MHVDVFRPSVSRQFVGAGIRADGFTSKKETASWHGDSFSPTPAERSLDLGLSIIDSVSKANSARFADIDDTAFDSCLVQLMGCAGRGGGLICVRGKRSRTCIIAKIASHGKCDSAFDEVSVDGSKKVVWITSIDFAYGNCFIMVNIALHKPPIGWNSVRVCMQRTESAPSQSPRRSP